MRTVIPCLLALSLASSLRAADTDWPQWRGPRRDAVSTEKNLLKEWPEKGPPLLWNSAEVNADKKLGASWSSVVVSNGKVFTMGPKDRKGFVFCLDEATGKLLWETQIDASADKPHGTPTVDGDRVYALSLAGQLVCIDIANGNIIWKKDIEKDFKGKRAQYGGYSESPLIDGDKIICCPGNEQATMVALKKQTGETIWTAAIAGAGEASHASIVIADVGGVRQYVTLVGSKKIGLVGVDASNGKFLWNYAGAAGGTAQAPTPIVKGDLVFTVTGFQGGSSLVQLIPQDGAIKPKELYHISGLTLENLQGGFVLVDGKIYGGHGHGDGKPFCLDFQTGKFDWKPVKGVGKGSAAVIYADGNLYFRYEDNVLALIEATSAGYKLKNKFQLPGDVKENFSHPTIANGRLYVRINDAVLCYDIRQK